MYEIRKAKLSEVPAVFSLLEKRVEWMRENNLHQWDECDYLKIFPLEHFEREAEKGELYVLVDNENILGTFILLEEDERWRGQEKKNSYYIHTLATVPGIHGLGGAILDYVEKRAKDNGKDSVRLDCQKSNIALNAYYEKHGYQEKALFNSWNYIGIMREKEIKA